MRFFDRWHEERRKREAMAMNLPGQARNYVSNNMTMYLSGVPMHRLPDLNFRAWKEYLSKDKLYQDVKKTGIFHGNFSVQELSRARREIVDLEHKTRGFKPLRKLIFLAEKAQDIAGDVYGVVEGVLKMAMVMDHIERLGMSLEDAAQEADAWLFDYSLVPQWVRAARGSPVMGAPFLTFQYKILPKLVEAALLRPHRLVLSWAAFKAAAIAAALALDVDDDDLDKLRKALPKWLQDQDSVLFIPYRDENGRWTFLNLSYFMPWSYFTTFAKDAWSVAKDVGTGGAGVGKVNELVGGAGIGGPFLTLYSALTTNIDPFTKREITTKGAPASIQLIELLNYAWDFMAPPMLGSRGFVSPMALVDPMYGGKAVQALTGAENRFGDPRSTMAQAILSLGGLNVYPINPQQSRNQNILRMSREIEDVKMSARKFLTDTSLSPERRQALFDKHSAEANRRTEILNDYIKESEVPYALR
ncbi:MAG: hypothetical protein IT532_01175 [Burkholderiales bacterium]|nr:hypothetical protein [Burkholderiales bacterium]